VYYTAHDYSGNSADSVSRVVYVVDSQIPHIEILGFSPVVLECGQAYSEEGAVAHEQCAGALPVTTTGAVDEATPGTYTITYTAMNPIGISATATRLVEVAAPEPRLIIRDEVEDNGAEPSPNWMFWESPDLVMIQNENTTDAPPVTSFWPAEDDPKRTDQLDLGLSFASDTDAYYYVGVRVSNVCNAGSSARAHVVIASFDGSEFTLDEWFSTGTAASPTAKCCSLSPASSSSNYIPNVSEDGGVGYAWFRLPQAVVKAMHSSGIHDSHGDWHPCLLAYVSTGTDPFGIADVKGSSPFVRDNNNMAQRNLSEVFVSSGSPGSFHFVMGHVSNKQLTAHLMIAHKGLPQGAKLELLLDGNDKLYPALNLDSQRKPLDLLEVNHKSIELRGRERLLDLTEPTTLVRLKKEPRKMYPLSLRFTPPEHAKPGDRFKVRIAQRNEKDVIVGGVTAVFVVREPGKEPKTKNAETTAK
jgi:hypothetical protein